MIEKVGSRYREIQELITKNRVLLEIISKRRRRNRIRMGIGVPVSRRRAKKSRVKKSRPQKKKVYDS